MKNDLISRSALIEAFKNPKTFETKLEITIDDIVAVINEQPTAYDVENVVAELEEELVDIGAKTGYHKGITKAIEIVRNGGKE